MNGRRELAGRMNAFQILKDAEPTGGWLGHHLSNHRGLADPPLGMKQNTLTFQAIPDLGDQGIATENLVRGSAPPGLAFIRILGLTGSKDDCAA